MIIASKKIEWMGNQRMGCKMVACHCEAPFVFVQHWKPSHYDWYRRYLKEKKNKQYDLPNLYIYTKTRKQYPHGLTYFWGKSGCKWSYKSPWWFLSKCKPVKKSQPSLKAQHNLFWVLETTLYVKKEHVLGETLRRNKKRIKTPTNSADERNQYYRALLPGLIVRDSLNQRGPGVRTS